MSSFDPTPNGFCLQSCGLRRKLEPERRNMTPMAQVCGAYLRAQGLEGRAGPQGVPRVSVAVDRQAGTPLAAVEAGLMRLLNPAGPQGPGWMLFDDALVHQVLLEHHLPDVLARVMPEDKAPRVDEFWREFLGGQPPQWELVQKTNDTIYRLAKRGGVVLVGRGAAWLTRDLPQVVKVALVGSSARRAGRLAEEEGGDRSRALAEVARRDEAAQRYLAAHFGRAALEGGWHDLVVNTDETGPETVAAVIHRVVEERAARFA